MNNFKLKSNKKLLIILLSIIIIFITNYILINNNHNFYNKTIAKITSIDETFSSVQDINNKKEKIKNQKIKATIMNGPHKGRKTNLKNKTSFSQINDLNLKVNDEIFVSLKEESNDHSISAEIIDLKRDKYLEYITLIFITLILLVGGSKGLRSLASVAVNVFIFLMLIQLFLKGYNLSIVSLIASVLFVVSSIIIVCGKNKKAFSAIFSTLITTFITMSISLLVITLNNWKGIHFESMEFLTHPPVKIFLAEILIGTLGAIMDISISMASSIKEIYDLNPDISNKSLVKSGMEIGKDIMGTMSNTLLFAYISGSIPMILLLMKNNYSISYIISLDLSLEIVRALTGSIGVVLCIPISIYISIFFINRFSRIK